MYHFTIDLEQQTDSVRLLFQINRCMVNTIWFRFDIIRFRKYFSLCVRRREVGASPLHLKTANRKNWGNLKWGNEWPNGNCTNGATSPLTGTSVYDFRLIWNSNRFQNRFNSIRMRIYLLQSPPLPPPPQPSLHSQTLLWNWWNCLRM